MNFFSRKKSSARQESIQREIAEFSAAADMDVKLKTIKDVQSTHFMIDIEPIIQALYPERIVELNVVDVGARTAAGTGLLAYLHHPSGNPKIRMNVKALDIDEQFKDRALEKYPEIDDYLIKNIFDEDMPKFDLVICSHTVEHVPNVDQFIRRLTEISRDFVIIACPYNEDLSKRYSNAPGNHINSFSNDDIAKLHPVMKKVYDGMCFTGDLVIFVLKGTAGRLEDEVGNFRKLEEAGQLDAALKSVEKTLEHRTTFSTIWVKYANLAQKTGDIHKAISACIKACRLHPNDPALRYRLAQLMKEGDFKHDALRQLEIAWDMKKSPDFAALRAELLIEFKRPDEAKAVLEKALFHKKDHPRVNALLTSLRG